MRKVMRSRSWSDLCRARCEKYVQQINQGLNNACIAWAITDLSHSYRPNIFKYRTAKLLRRAIKNGRVKENPIATENYRNYVKEIIEIYGFDARYI